MTLVEKGRTPVAIIPVSVAGIVRDIGRWTSARPATLLLLLSAVFGLATIGLNPPLRGPDEPAHFVRAYDYARGVILPAAEVEGRKGTYLPADIYDGFNFFRDAQERFWSEQKIHYNGVYADYLRHRAERTNDTGAPAQFVLYEGSEAYSPLAYLPHIAAGWIARGLDLDFLATITLMRLFGLAAMTAAAAYAIAATPYLKWTFFLIAMLPAALYGRTVVSADGATVSYALVVAALCLRAASGRARDRAWERAVWMVLCALAKPPQIAFLLLEPMTARVRDWPRRWRTLALVTVPAATLAVLWLHAISGEMAAWRMAEGLGLPVEQFGVKWKLGLMLERPLHFPAMALTTFVNEAALYGKQMIGVLGWLDMPLLPWVYPVLGIMLAAVALERLDLEAGTRARVAAWSAAAALAYWLAVYLVFFVTWTPLGEPQILGVQGRYLIPALPAVGVAVAAAVHWRMPPGLLAAIAMSGAFISGAATVETLLRVLW